MALPKTLVLNETQVEQKINRIAYQLYEDNADEKSLVIAGVAPNGFRIANKIAAALKKLSPMKVEILEVVIEKDKPLSKEIKLSMDPENLKGKVIILVDDVFNSGRTMIYALRPFLSVEAKKIRTVVLVDRSHKQFPIAADYVGISLATTMQEHISVEHTDAGEAVYLK